MFVADKIHIKKNKFSPNKWDVFQTFSLFGLCPVNKKYFYGLALTRDQVKNLKVPLVKFCVDSANAPFPQCSIF